MDKQRLPVILTFCVKWVLLGTCKLSTGRLVVALTDSRPIGYAGITDTFAASLWTLNFFLYAATLGISSGKTESATVA